VSCLVLGLFALASDDWLERSVTYTYCLYVGLGKHLQGIVEADSLLVNVRMEEHF